MTGRGLTQAGPRWLAWLVLVVASVLFIASVVLAAWGGARPYPGAAGVAPNWDGHGPMMGANGRGWVGPSGGMMGAGGGSMMSGSMMGGGVWLAGDGVRVDTITQARARATQAAAVSGLTPGEVMQFTNNFYVELRDASGEATTEVLVDPATGAVSTEYGPAMMWNTGSRTAAMSADEAVAIADGWLQTNAAGETAAGMAMEYPGYYTLDTASGGTTVGMLSVNATTGAVWYHTWHGEFVAEEDA